MDQVDIVKVDIEQCCW